MVVLVRWKVLKVFQEDWSQSLGGSEVFEGWERIRKYLLGLKGCSMVLEGFDRIWEVPNVFKKV